MLTLRALGKFSLVDEFHSDLSPSGQKARGLIVLLAVAPGLTRSRTWLQSKLWSDRSKDQASSSLRTCLAEIRKSLGLHKDILQTNRTSISFDAEKFCVDYTRSEFLSEAGRIEPFEDINIRDSEFERLILDLRAKIADSHIEDSASTSISLVAEIHTVLIVSDYRGGALAEIAGKCISQQICNTLGSTGDFNTFTCDVSQMSGLSNKPTSFPTLRLLLIEVQGEVFISCGLHIPNDGAEIWSANTTIAGGPAAIVNSVEVARLTLQAVGRISDTAVRHASLMASGKESAFALEYHAKQLLFQLDRSSLTEADRLLKLAFEIEPRGQYLAWRGFLRNIAFFQHRTSAFLDNQTSVVDFSLEALRHSPEHATVQAIASQLDYIHQGDVETSLAIALQAVELDSSNPLTWAFLSNALTASNRSKEGYETACKSVALSVGSRTQFFFEHFACMSAVASLDYRQAMTHAQTALRFRPEFVSTRRYEVALAMQLDDKQSLDRSVSAMRNIEAGFTPTTMLEHNYPVTTMRRLPLIDVVR